MNTEGAKLLWIHGLRVRSLPIRPPAPDYSGNMEDRELCGNVWCASFSSFSLFPTSSSSIPKKTIVAEHHVPAKGFLIPLPAHLHALRLLEYYQSRQADFSTAERCRWSLISASLPTAQAQSPSAGKSFMRASSRSFKF